VLSYDNVLMGALVAVLDLRTAQPHLKSSTKSPPGEVLLLDQNAGSCLAAALVQPTNVAGLQWYCGQLLARPASPWSFKG